MGFLLDDKNEENPIIYRGVPNKSENKTIVSSWMKFKQFFLPWLSEKRQLGEDYLQAKVRKEQAEAFKTYAEGLVQVETAKKIARDSAKQESEKIALINFDNLSEGEIKAHIQELESKLHRLSLMYGTRVIPENNLDNSNTIAPDNIEKDKKS